MTDKGFVIAIFMKENEKIILKIDSVNSEDHFWLETKDGNGNLIEKSEVAIEWENAIKLLEQKRVVHLEKDYLDPDFFQLFYHTFHRIIYPSFSAQRRILYILRLFYNKTKIRKEKILNQFDISSMQFTRDLRDLRNYLVEEGKGINYNRLENVYELVELE
jgi:hypothetical protein